MQRGCLSNPELDLSATVSKPGSSIFNDSSPDRTQTGSDDENFSSLLLSLPSSYLSALNSQTYCHPFSFWQVFAYNYTFVLFYFLGLNFTHLDKLPIKHLSLKMTHIRKWGKSQLIFLTFVCLIVLANLIISFIMFAESGVLGLYVSIIVGFVAFCTVISFILRKTHYFHLHHYVWGGVLMILCGYQNLYITSIGALTAGIFVEGVARWGFHRWWYVREPETPLPS